MDYEEGAACLAPKDDAAAAAPELTKEEEYRREDAFDQISAIHTGLLGGRASALSQLALDSAHKDVPPWWQEAALGAASVALATATAGLGSSVLVGVGAALKGSGLGVAVAEAAVKGLSSAAKSFMGKAIQEAAKPALEPGTDSAAQFFRMQEQTVRNSAFDQQNVLTKEVRPAIRATPDSVAQAEAIARGMATIDPAQAGLIQRQASLDAWCTYRAKASLESERDASVGPTNMRAALAEGELPGVLELKVVAGGPGSRVQVLSAQIAGMNARLRSDLTGRSIGSLRVPMVVSAVVHPGSALPSPDGAPARAHGPGCMHAKLARDEGGNVLLATDSGPAQTWFALRGGAETASSGADVRASLDASTRGAAVFVHDDIEPQVLTAEVMK
ncbi:MAG: hypothetical protein R3F39_08600 [Myxococcota bacterium]